jgi:hypothetical protein
MVDATKNTFVLGESILVLFEAGTPIQLAGNSTVTMLKKRSYVVMLTDRTMYFPDKEELALLLMKQTHKKYYYIPRDKCFFCDCSIVKGRLLRQWIRVCEFCHKGIGYNPDTDRYNLYFVNVKWFLLR